MLSHYWTQSIWNGAAKRWTPTSIPQPFLLFASGNLRLLKRLQGWCSQHRLNLYLSEPDSQDLILMPYFAAVIERRFVGELAWENFCQYRHVSRLPVPPELAEEFSDLAEGQDPLVIVVDLKKKRKKLIGEINPFNLFFVPASLPGEVVRLLDERGLLPDEVSRGDQYPRHS